jgi:transaldolase
MSPLRRLVDFGQSPWLDFIQRSLVRSGELERMIGAWGLAGMTSNPVIFEQAIVNTDDYSADIERLARAGKSGEEIYEALAIEDVRSAADRFRGVYDTALGADGFVSLEVSPHLARDALGTVAAATRLWAALDRPNVMIKVPGTTEGLSALTQLLAEGLNVNVTLLFSVARYRAVANAYLAGIEAALASDRDVNRVASVASFFLSRIDTAVDRQLDRLVARNGSVGEEAQALRGEAAIASARLAYAVFEEIFASERFRRLAVRGARPQRLLWASTGTKDKSYSDIKYVEPLIGPLTVNTMPLATLRAYDDHGCPASRLPGTRRQAEEREAALARLGIPLESIAAELLEDGLDKFVRPYDSLMEMLERTATQLSKPGDAVIPP